jgi:hypothetical protein
MLYMPNETEQPDKLPVSRRKNYVIKARVTAHMKREMERVAAEREETEANVIRTILREGLAKRVLNSAATVATLVSATDLVV